MKSGIKSVNEKSTKQEILSAYEEIAVKLGETNSSDLTSKFTKANSTLETNLKDTVAQLQENLNNALNATLEQLSEATKAIAILREAHEAQKKVLEQEKTQIIKDQTRLAEEQNYEFAKLKKRQEEELREQKLKAETELAARKDALKIQEDELADLRNQVKTFDAKLAKATSDAVTSATKDLKLQFDHEKALFGQKTQATQELLEQQITSLQETVSAQKLEITRMNSLASEASAQMTKIAERAVTKGAPETISSTTTQKNLI